ncbi:MAG: helix-turn-helix domain-containing protein [Phycisphaerae bacterium]
MSGAEHSLCERIRELRRRHFGARGRDELARRLNVPLDTYARYERDTIPPGAVLVQMCELTGEDLQWLLTGVASRGAVVISGARRRHQDLLARLAQLLDTRPALATPIEAFLDLLQRPSIATDAHALAEPAPRGLIPVFELDELGDSLPDDDGPRGGLWRPPAGVLALAAPSSACLSEPVVSVDADADGEPRRVSLVRGGEPGARERLYVDDDELRRSFPRVFGARLADAEMSPMFAPGDVLLVARDAAAQVGRPALFKPAGAAARCRLWLGAGAHGMELGRVGDGAREQLASDSITWALEVLFRVAPAA